MYVRPHDFGIDDHANGAPSFTATVERMHSAGPALRLELAANGQHLTAAVSQAQGAALGIREGARVWVSPRAWHVFGDGRKRGNR
jgi:sulfate transport system ATP-binding protein